MANTTNRIKIAPNFDFSLISTATNLSNHGLFEVLDDFHFVTRQIANFDVEAGNNRQQRGATRLTPSEILETGFANNSRIPSSNPISSTPRDERRTHWTLAGTVRRPARRSQVAIPNGSRVRFQPRNVVSFFRVHVQLIFSLVSCAKALDLSFREAPTHLFGYIGYGQLLEVLQRKDLAIVKGKQSQNLLGLLCHFKSTPLIRLL